MMFLFYSVPPGNIGISRERKYFKTGTSVLIASIAVVVAMLASVASAGAVVPGPGWGIDSFASPTNFSEAENAVCGVGASAEFCDSYQVTATNSGSEPTDGSPVTITDTLPEGLSVHQIFLLWSATPNVTPGAAAEEELAKEACTTPATRVVQCTLSAAQFAKMGHTVRPDERLRMDVYVTVDAGAEGSLTNVATVSGGGGATVSTGEAAQLPQQTNEISSSVPPFGLSNFEFFKDSLNGSAETQAGGHPYELNVVLDLNNELRTAPDGGSEVADVDTLKDVVVDLPLGFAGSTLSAPECTEAQLSSEQHCPPNTIVGHLQTEPENNTSVASYIYNLVPEHGYPAEFGYIDGLKGAHTFYVHVVPTAQGYVLQTTNIEIPEINLRKITVTFYGDPALRDGTGGTQIPFFTNPTACSGGPQVATIWVDSWQRPGRLGPGDEPVNLAEPAWVKSKAVTPPVTGCNALAFTPELGVQPTTHQADSPSGLEFETKLFQSEKFGTNATPALKNLTVTFPAGMTVDPSSADGLGTCSEAQIGYEGPTLFDFSPYKPQCPESSKIGSLELETPLIPGKIFGEVFLAAQNENPFHSTFAIYVIVNDPITGVVLKIAGELKANPSTGQLTSFFPENPQLPFSVLEVHFFGGPRAELATPPDCGIYTTHSELEPWSAPDSGPIGTPFDSYEINENCAIGFAPNFTGGSTNLQAGAYTTFQASFEREDDDQELAGATINLPPGMLANVPNVTECGEAEIKAEEADRSGGCPASSQVGTVEAGAGPGPNPLFVPGKVFWTGPYNGGPFGLAVVVSANPGPFHFGNVVVRQSIRINPLTAAVTDISDPFPTYLDPVAPDGQTTGIPIKLRRVDVEINRPGFTFNPTNCGKFQVGGAITSTHAASKTLATPFQVTNCATLKFAPKFAVSTTAKNSKANGTSLTAKLSYPSAPQGTYADITKVKVELPKALPSRLTTLQKACTLIQFDTNPANCPSESKIGYATVHTPILPGGLSGPAIFVSHGGEAFPTLTMVLQGDGVTIEVVGTTYISKAGVTSTTFKTVPDSPFSTFELTLPEGKYSALTALGNLCTQKLIMPSEFVSQNGAEIHVNTPVTVNGCPKVKALTRAQKLAKALKACKQDKNKSRRENCEKTARKTYGAPRKKSKGGSKGKKK